MVKEKNFRRSKFLRAYAGYLEELGLKVDPIVWFVLSGVIAIVGGLITFFVLQLIGAEFAYMMVVVIVLVLLDLLIGYPYIRGQQRISEIENNLPEALKQMADVLKAGGTYEFALREISQSDFGPLTKELNRVMRKLEEGENFENSLMSLSYNVDSRLVKRSVTIIIDSVRAGAGLADILDQIADDIRDTNRITQERKSKTLMQVLFMIAAGVMVSPFIFGLISTILGFLIGSVSGLGAAPEAVVVTALEKRDLILFLLQLYILIQVTATSVMISLMREGKKTKSIIYLPFLLFMAYIVYFISLLFSGNIIQGMAGGVR